MVVKGLAILAGVICCSLHLGGEEPDRILEPVLTRYTFAEPHMGTQFKIILYAPDEATANGAAKAAFTRIADLDRIMTDYRPTSELMQLCARSGGAPVKVSDDLFAVLTRSQEVAKRSDGAFDITVGPLVRLWRISRRTQKLPDPDKLAAAKALTGYDKVKLDPTKQTVELTTPGMQLDLGGIGKGYAADAALAALKKLGVTRALVAAGGDIAVSGPPPDAAGWKVGIQPLERLDGDPSEFLILRDAAVSTSGDAEQFVEIGGTRYSHIMDPKTGLGLQGRMSVTVVGPNGTTVDPLTKVVAILGKDKGVKIIDETDGVAALGVVKTDKGLETFQSKRWKDVQQKK